MSWDVLSFIFFFVLGFVCGGFLMAFIYESRRGLPIYARHEPAQTARFEFNSPDGKTKRIYEFEHATNAQMATIADHIATGNAVTMAYLERLKGNRTHATALRDELVEKGLFRYRDPGARKEGMDITRKGEVFFRELANNRTLPRWRMPGVKVRDYASHTEYREIK